MHKFKVITIVLSLCICIVISLSYLFFANNSNYFDTYRNFCLDLYLNLKIAEKQSSGITSIVIDTETLNSYPDLFNNPEYIIKSLLFLLLHDITDIIIDLPLSIPNYQKIKSTAFNHQLFSTTKENKYILNKEFNAISDWQGKILYPLKIDSDMNEIKTDQKVPTALFNESLLTSFFQSSINFIPVPTFKTIPDVPVNLEKIQSGFDIIPYPKNNQKIRKFPVLVKNKNNIYPTLALTSAVGNLSKQKQNIYYSFNSIYIKEKNKKDLRIPFTSNGEIIPLWPVIDDENTISFKQVLDQLIILQQMQVKISEFLNKYGTRAEKSLIKKYLNQIKIINDSNDINEIIKYYQYQEEISRLVLVLTPQIIHENGRIEEMRKKLEKQALSYRQGSTLQTAISRNIRQLLAQKNNIISLQSDYELVNLALKQIIQNKSIYLCDVSHKNTQFITPSGEIIFKGQLFSLIQNAIKNKQLLITLPLLFEFILFVLLVFLIYLIKNLLSEWQFIFTGIFFFILFIGLSFFLFYYYNFYLDITLLLPFILLEFILLALTSLIMDHITKNQLLINMGPYISRISFKNLKKNLSDINKSGSENNISILTIKLNNFFHILPKNYSLLPTEILNIFKQLYTDLFQIVLKNGGKMIPPLQDKLVIIFSDLYCERQHADMAVKSALLLSKEVDKINQIFLAHNLNLVSLNCGIETDLSISGLIDIQKQNFFWIYGRVFFISEQLINIAKKYNIKILIGENTYRQTKDRINVRMLDKIKLSELNESIRVFELIDFKDELNIKEDIIRYFHAGLKLYEERNWKKAAGYFKKCLLINKNDYPAKMYYDRCLTFIKLPPRLEWDGEIRDIDLK